MRGGPGLCSVLALLPCFLASQRSGSCRTSSLTPGWGARFPPFLPPVPVYLPPLPFCLLPNRIIANHCLSVQSAECRLFASVCDYVRCALYTPGDREVKLRGNHGCVRVEAGLLGGLVESDREQRHCGGFCAVARPAPESQAHAPPNGCRPISRASGCRAQDPLGPITDHLSFCHSHVFLLLLCFTNQMPYFF